MAGKRKAEDDIPGTSQPPAGPTKKTMPDAEDSPDASLLAAARGSDDSERRTVVEPPALRQWPTTGGRGKHDLMAAAVAGGPAFRLLKNPARGSDDSERRTEVEPPTRQQRPTTGGSGKHDLMAAAAAAAGDSAFRPVKNPASWTLGGSAMGADLPRPSQWNYDMPPQQHFQSPQQYQMFLEGHTGLPVRVLPGFVFPPSKTVPASASYRLARPGQMRQQSGGANRSIIPREDAEQRSASMREDASRRELLQQGKRQKLDEEQATMSALQGKLRLDQPAAAAQATVSGRQENLRLGHPGAAAQAREQATMSSRQETLRLGQHPAAAHSPVLIGQSVATSRGLASPRLIVPCLCCRARPALTVFNPIEHLCICVHCFSDPSMVCPVCRPG